MFNNSNLSFDAAPPIKVVLRFFLSGAIFGFIASVFALFNYDSFSNIAEASTLTFVHLFTLGVMASFMFGALFQMLPVIAGVSINSPTLISMRVNYALIFGTILLVSSFYSNSAIVYTISGLLLGYAIFATSYIMIKELIKVNKTSSVKGMLLAVVSLFLVALLGLLLISARGGIDLPFNYLDLKNIHFSFGLFGWISMLIISVAFQVIEMFYVTPPYPKAILKYLTTAIFALLVITLIFPALTSFIDTIISILLAIFAIYTLIRLSQKKRAVSDATIWFWRLAMASLILFSLAVILNNFIDINFSLIATFYIFFAIGVVNAMVFKIVPFLVWFQLNRAGYFDGPMMHEVIHPKVAKYNFYLLIAAYLLLIIGTSLISSVTFLAILLFGASFLLLSILIYKAWHKYLFTLQFGTKINFPSKI